MSHRFANVVAIVLAELAMFFSCADIPRDPMEDPSNSSVKLFLKDGGDPVVDFGARREIGLEITLTNLLDTIRISSECIAIDTQFSVDTTNQVDTIWLNPGFEIEGQCVITAEATMRNHELRNRTGMISIRVLAEKPGVHFIDIPSDPHVTCGKADTLLLIVAKTGGASVPEFTLTVSPRDGDEFFIPEYSSRGDTVRIVATPQTAGKYEIMLVATSTFNDSLLSDTATVLVKVKNGITPSVIHAPEQLIAGKADTLLFAVDNSNRPDPLTIELLGDPPLDPAVFSIIPTGPDSIMIAISPEASSAKTTIGIVTGNGTESDTSRYPVTIISSEAALWNTTTLDLNLVEGTPFALNMMQYLSSAHAGNVFLSSDIGTVEDSVWSFTPEWGCAEEMTATIIATEGDVSLSLTLVLSIAAGDVYKPVLKLIDETVDGKTVSSSQITVQCQVNDSGAGIDKVLITSGAQNVTATLQDGSVYSGVITGLVHGVATEIVITATDGSRNKNSATLKFSVTRDSTMLDADAPTIVQTSGRQNGDRVTEASGSLQFTVKDDSGIDSVWWTLNGGAGGTLTLQEGTCKVLYTLTERGSNTVTVHARDNAVGKNEDSLSVPLNFNTPPEPATVTIVAPQDKAKGVAATPTFSWNRVTDADGDEVYYAVFYGFSAGSLVARLTVTQDTSISIIAANALTVNKEYFWQVAAFTKTPFADTVRSAVVSFTTAGMPVKITKPPSYKDSIFTGETVGLTVEAEGNPLPRYQWMKDGAPLSGDTLATLTLIGVTSEDNGEYTVMVKNGVGPDITSDPVTVKVLTKAEITKDPQGKTVNEDEDVTFTVSAKGDVPLSFKWLVNGSPAGGTDTLFTVATVTPQDSGKRYRCIVSNSFSSDTSREAVLLVTPKNMYAVNFDTDGGSRVDTQWVKEGERAERPQNNPTKTDNEFAGWYSPKTASAEYDFNTVITSNRTIYARWTPQVTISFDGNGATTQPSPSSRTIIAGRSITSFPTEPEKTSYTFFGWWTGEGGAGDSVTSSMTFNSAKTVYAKWVIMDADKNLYTEVKIGNQVWMVENLKTAKFNNGSSIEMVEDDALWEMNSGDGAYCWYGNLESNKNIYGALYDWSAVNKGVLAPKGWHVPTDAEWDTLASFLGGEDVAGGKLKESGTAHWESPNAASNESGFTGLPGGMRRHDGAFLYFGNYGKWWSTTEYSSSYAWSHDLRSENGLLGKDWSDMKSGFSVRCIRD